MLNQGRVTQAVFPVAGLGTRFLPVTKASPKEMLPIVDKPLIQYAVEEAVAAGINELIFVTNSEKHAIEDHFSSNIGLEMKLSEQGNLSALGQIQSIVPSHVRCVFVHQPIALGLGDAILMTKKLIRDKPFAVLLADDLVDNNGGPSCLQQLLHYHAAVNETVIAVEGIPLEATEKYGVVQTPRHWENAGKIEGIVEKPKPEKAPSQLGVIGRYILEPSIFACLEQVKPGRGGEIQLTDALALLLKSEPVHAMKFAGKRYDCGCKLGYLQASIIYALRHPEVQDGLNLFLKELG